MNDTTLDEQRQLKKILKKLTPSKSIHTEYIAEANEFLEEYKFYKSQTKSIGVQLPIKSMKLLESTVFQKSYLAAWADDEWFSLYAPSYDAIATPALSALVTKSVYTASSVKTKFLL
jgi:hypothetical protein